MTCVAGVEADGVVWLAGESELSNKHERNMIARTKVWVRDGLVWGWAGESRPAGLIRYGWRTPRLPRAKDGIANYVISELIPSLRAALVSDGCADVGWSALVGVRGELWWCDSAGMPAERGSEGYSAVGCGSTAALVGLSLTANLSPRVRLTRVVSAVCRHVPGCGGKITVVSA